MERIIIEIKNNQEFNNLLKFGKSCDVDLEHLPFSEFYIYTKTDREVRQLEAIEMAKQVVELSYPKLDLFSKNALIKKQAEDFMQRNFKDNTNYLKDKITIEKGKITLTRLDADPFIVEGFPSNRIFNTSELDNLKFTVYDTLLKKHISIDAMIKKAPDLIEYRDSNFETVLVALGAIATFQATKTPIPRKTEMQPHSNKTKQANKKKSNKRVQYVKNTVYSLSLTDTIEANTDDPREKQKYQYHISSWYQRGHWRTYKSGKRVWVHACFKSPKQKRKDAEEVTEKYYRLKEV